MAIGIQPKTFVTLLRKIYINSPSASAPGIGSASARGALVEPHLLTSLPQALRNTACHLLCLARCAETTYMVTVGGFGEERPLRNGIHQVFHS